MQGGQQCTHMTELLAALFLRQKLYACECVCMWEKEKRNANCYLERYNKCHILESIFVFITHAWACGEQIHAITQLHA